MADAFRGLYRTVAWAYVTNGAMAFQVPEAEYRAFGYQPEYNRLPWRDDYITGPVIAARPAPVQAAAP
jgi:surface antigen